MSPRVLPFDIQYLILAELSRFDPTYQVLESDWKTTVNVLCVSKQWHNSFQDLLCQNTPAYILLTICKGVGTRAVDKAVAGYVARQSACSEPARCKQEGSPHSSTRPSATSTAHRNHNESEPQDADIQLFDDSLRDLEYCVGHAAYRGYIDPLRTLLHAGFEYDRSIPLAAAIDGDQLAVIEFLLDGAYVDINEEIDHSTPLGVAVFDEKPAIADLLLARGADRHIRVSTFVTESEDSLSLVSYAAFKNNMGLLNVLLSHDLAIEDTEYHHRPIWWAIYHENIEMARAFIRKGADLSPTLHGEWPLFEAVRFGNAEMVLLMLEEGGMPEDASEITHLYYEIAVCGSLDVQEIFS
ncbi:ankyrin repeat-containing domain protein [Aspergillus heterothallicus]